MICSGLRWKINLLWCFLQLLVWATARIPSHIACAYNSLSGDNQKVIFYPTSGRKNVRRCIFREAYKTLALVISMCQHVRLCRRYEDRSFKASAILEPITKGSSRGRSSRGWRTTRCGQLVPVAAISSLPSDTILSIPLGYSHMVRNTLHNQIDQHWFSQYGVTVGDVTLQGRNFQPRNRLSGRWSGSSFAGEVGSQYGLAICCSATSMRSSLWPPVGMLRFSGHGRLTVLLATPIGSATIPTNFLNSRGFSLGSSRVIATKNMGHKIRISSTRNKRRTANGRVKHIFAKVEL